MQQAQLYFLSDQYYQDFPDDKLMQNKDIINGAPHSRPCFFAFKDTNSTLQIFFILSNKKTYNLLYLLYSISANKSLQKQEIVCHAYFTTETILLTSFFGSFGIIFRMPQCHLRKICSCWSFPCWPWILSAPSGLHGCI